MDTEKGIDIIGGSGYMVVSSWKFETLKKSALKRVSVICRVFSGGIRDQLVTIKEMKIFGEVKAPLRII